MLLVCWTNGIPNIISYVQLYSSFCKQNKKPKGSPWQTKRKEKLSIQF